MLLLNREASMIIYFVGQGNFRHDSTVDVLQLQLQLQLISNKDGKPINLQTFKTPTSYLLSDVTVEEDDETSGTKCR